jgi:hypothetical protein
VSELTSADLSYPILTWGKDYIFTTQSHKLMTQGDKSLFEWLQKAARSGEVRLLDSSGKLYDIIDKVHIPTKSRFRQIFGPFETETILANPRQLELEEFKSFVLKAVRARQRYDRGTDIVERTQEKLPFSRTFREAIESLPKTF